MFERKKFENIWEVKMEPFKIIGNHVWNNDAERKSKLLLETGENQFVHDKIWGEFLDFCEKRLTGL